MKLLNYTTSYFAAILLVLLGIWAVIFYLEMLDEIYDSLDDGLDNQKMLVINRAKSDPEIIQRLNFEDGSYTIKPISNKLAMNFRDSYRVIGAIITRFFNSRSPMLTDFSKA